jgi:hypothetical protein
MSAKAQRKSSRSALTPEDLDLIEQYACAKARESFAVYRRLMRPTMLWGWFLDEVCEALQTFYDDLMLGKRPKLVLMAPPQHGKSWTLADYVSWVAGKNPNLRSIYASYSGELSTRANHDVQRSIMSERYRKIFGKIVIGEPGWACNTEHIEYCGYSGDFRNTTVNGQITGHRMSSTCGTICA